MITFVGVCLGISTLCTLCKMHFCTNTKGETGKEKAWGRVRYTYIYNYGMGRAKKDYTK
jgi:hypothetical protein